MVNLGLGCLFQRHTQRGPLWSRVSCPALTQTPDIHIEEPLESGSPSHLTCSVPGACDGVTPLTLSWTGAALRPPGLDLEAYNSSEILLTPRPQDHGTNLTCHVTFPRAGVSTQSTITLNVSCESGGGGRGAGAGLSCLQMPVGRGRGL